MNISIVTLFPEMFTPLNHGIVGRAIKQNIAHLFFYNPRDYTKSKHRCVDDRPYGGGPGMVMMVQPLYDAILAAKTQHPNSKVIMLSPQGRLYNQTAANSLAHTENLVLVTGRYEGIDERLISLIVDEEWSIGDYVLSGGELAAMTIVDTIVRLLPNALGDEQSAQQDSFMQGLLDFPHYTRPERFNGQNVPNVLLSGNHELISRWRLKQMIGRTYLRRPELIQKHILTAEEQELLQEFLQEYTVEAKHE